MHTVIVFELPANFSAALKEETGTPPNILGQKIQTASSTDKPAAYTKYK
jgi:hypothetical protein